MNPQRVDVFVERLEHLRVRGEPAKRMTALVCVLERPVGGIVRVLEVSIPQILRHVREGEMRAIKASAGIY